MATIKPGDQPPPYSDGVGQQAYPPGPGYPQQGNAYPPGPGWNPPPHAMHPAPAANQGATIIVQPVPTPGTRVVLVGGCPTCHAGVLEDTFGFCAIFLAIFFFPIGILCCLAMKEKRCTNCGTHY